jgi:hypothetical protein
MIHRHEFKSFSTLSKSKAKICTEILDKIIYLGNMSVFKRVNLKKKMKANSVLLLCRKMNKGIRGWVLMDLVCVR